MYMVSSFCMVRNSRNLLKLTEDGLEVLYGIRFFSVVVIVLGHQIMYSTIGPISDGMDADKKLDSSISNILVHDDVLVDTFFMMSGLLLMKALMFFKELPNIFLIIVKRYVRLVPGLAMVIFYICAALRHTGDGPLWPKYVKQETSYCFKNWWTNLIMMNNFIDTQNMCYHLTWYIPCDFQMFVVAVLMFWVWSKNRVLGIATAILVAIASFVIPVVITYYYQIAALPIMSFEILSNSRNSLALNIFYIKTYNRFSSYLVGMITGYVFIKYKINDERYRISKKTAITGTVVSLVMMLGVLVYGAHLHRTGGGRIECALFAAFNRPIWSLSIALLVLCCSYGSVPIISPFLSWYPWMPLSRLAFGVYLIHGLVVHRNVYITRNLYQRQPGNILINTLGATVTSTILAYLMWILFEAPVNNIFSIIVTPRCLLKKTLNKMATKEEFRNVETKMKA